MKKLLTPYLIWVILALINSNGLLAQYSTTFNNPWFFYSEPLNLSNLSSENDLGINTHIVNKYTIYPNPNTGKFYFDLKEAKSKIHVDIYNVWGKKIYESSTLLPLTTNEIDFSLHPKGVYFVKINDGEMSQTEKIIIQ